MTPRTSLLQLLCSFLLLATATSALRFELEAKKSKDVRDRCIRNFVGRDTLVVVTAVISGDKGDGQVVNMKVRVPGNGFPPPSILGLVYWLWGTLG